MGFVDSAGPSERSALLPARERRELHELVRELETGADRTRALEPDVLAEPAERRIGGDLPIAATGTPADPTPTVRQ